MGGGLFAFKMTPHGGAILNPVKVISILVEIIMILDDTIRINDVIYLMKEF